MNCEARTCRILNLSQQETDKSQYWCNHSKISLRHVPEGESDILDAEDVIGPSSPPHNNQQPAGASQYFPAPESNIWPRPAIQQLPIPNEDQDEPPIDQIIGDLPNLRIPKSNDLPPSMSKHHYNSLLFLSRLLQSKDNLSSKDITAMQKSEPMFCQIFKEIERYDDFKIDKNGILFKLINPPRGPKFYVLCLPPQFAKSTGCPKKNGDLEI